MKLSEWRSQFVGKYNQYINRLSQVGVDAAQGTFDLAPPEFGNGGVTVDREIDGVDFRIIASGHDAAFLEFGTGVGVLSYPVSEVSGPEFPIEDGSWSREVNGPYSKNGYWYYNGQRLQGTPALGGMQEAKTRMQQESPTIAGSVFT